MNKQYAFSTLFSEEARRKTAKLRYQDTPFMGEPCPRNVDSWDDFCPVGALMRFDGHYSLAEPTALHACNSLRRDGVRASSQMIRSMDAFMKQWDRGKIKSLAVALGVEDEVTS